MNTMLRAVSRAETLSEQIYQELRRSLLEGALPRRQKMTIRSLAKDLGTSPTPVREAVARLVSEQALAMGATRSIYVPSLSAEALAEIGDIRQDLEGRAAAAAHLSEPRVTVLRRRLARARDAAAADDRRGAAAYVELHLLIYQSSRSPILVNLIERVWAQVAHYLCDVFSDPDLAEENLRRHTALVDALASRDAETIGNAIRACIGWQTAQAIQIARREDANGVPPDPLQDHAENAHSSNRLFGIAGA